MKLSSKSFQSARTMIRRGVSLASCHRHPRYNPNYSQGRFFSSSTGDNLKSEEPSNIFCDVIQGPSLLRTPVPRPNPSLMFLPGLRSLPFWTSYSDGTSPSKIAYQDPTVAAVLDHLQSHAPNMQQEYENVAPKIPSDYENTDHNPTALHQGKETWKWHTYLSKGHVQGNFAWQFPETAKALQELRKEGLLFEGTPFGFAFFSNLAGGSTISAHTAPMNLRLRIHLPLIVPQGSHEIRSEDGKPAAGIRVANQVRPWTPHQALVLDDSFDHEVWNHTSQERIILLVDIWHPDISPPERQEIVNMFQHARQQGLWKR